MVKSGFGIGLLQKTMIEKDLADGTLELVDCIYNTRPILYKNYLAYFKRKKKELQPLVEFLLET